MKKIVLIDASQRERANSEIVVSMVTEALSDTEVHVLRMKDQDCRYCIGCDTCQKTDTLICSRKDDITKLLPHIDSCDAILLASPVYDHQMSSLAKLFIERFYAFYNPNAENSSTVTKRKKKAAFVMCCWTGDKTVYKKYAEWTLEGFWQIDAAETRAEIFNGLNGREEILQHSDYLTKIQEIADWLKT
ncbi:MAG: NAD(P)H-dependent oxidoreductase [Clostridia bacterium]|nr:NAD(P)H-dependent oxidoreductase [Clostridia bacterium]